MITNYSTDKKPRALTNREYLFIINMIGDKYKDKKINLNKIKVIEKKYGASSSDPYGVITVKPDKDMNKKRLSCFIHEVFHQYQYQYGWFESNIKSFFEKLINNIHNKDDFENTVYRYDKFINLDIPYSDFFMIKYQEAEAQFIQDYVYYYLEYKFEYNHDSREKAKKYASVLYNSGFSSKVILELL